MKPQRPSFANSQAIALKKRREFTGYPELAAYTEIDRDTWLTPRYLLDRLGMFDLDPCAATAQPYWVAAKSFTVDIDGLKQEWAGRVFCNPPYSNTPPWVEKQAAYGLGIMLIPAAVDSIHWRRFVWTKAAAVLLLHGRTRFAHPDGSITHGRPLRSCALIAWGCHDADILRRCGIAGVFLDNWKQT